MRSLSRRGGGLDRKALGSVVVILGLCLSLTGCSDEASALGVSTEVDATTALDSVQPLAAETPSVEAEQLATVANDPQATPAILPSDAAAEAGELTSEEIVAESVPEAAAGPDAPDHDTAPASSDPTHEQIGVIELALEGEQQSKLTTFCLAADGRVVTAWGGKQVVTSVVGGKRQTKTIEHPTLIRIFDRDGKLETTWPVDIVPQSLNIGPDGSIFAAGQGEMIRLDSKGTMLARGATPQVEAVRANAEKIKAEYEKMLAEFEGQYEELAAAARKREEELAANEAPTPAEERLLASARRQREMYEDIQEEQKASRATQAERMLESKLAIRGLAVTEEDVFISCNGVEGHGYDVWRMNHDFSSPVKIVSDLRGCCGNMDIQAGNGELYVAENSRHRVGRYDRDGKLIAEFGKPDREDTSANGFASCCNPMNLRFGPGGEVYTAESELGRIKRFNPDGTFLGVVGKVKLVPGCKQVAIAVTPDGGRVYMLDITRNQIIIMGRKVAQQTDAEGAVAAGRS